MVDSIIDGFLSPYLPKKTGNPDYAVIRYTHRLLTKNAVLIKSPCIEVKKVHLILVLTEMQYMLVRLILFIHPTNPNQEPTIPVCTSFFNKNIFLG